jgi:hypothetical protein
MTVARMASIGIGIMDNNVPKQTFYGNSVPSVADS